MTYLFDKLHPETGGLLEVVDIYDPETGELLDPPELLKEIDLIDPKTGEPRIPDSPPSSAEPVGVTITWIYDDPKYNEQSVIQKLKIFNPLKCTERVNALIRRVDVTPYEQSLKEYNKIKK